MLRHLRSFSGKGVFGMARVATCYADQTPPYYYNVTFIVRETGAKLTKSFDSEYLAYKFVNKLKHSKRCVLVSYPLFK